MTGPGRVPEEVDGSKESTATEQSSPRCATRSSRTTGVPSSRSSSIGLPPWPLRVGLMRTPATRCSRSKPRYVLSRSDEVWVFGRLSLGVKVQVGIAKRLSKPVRYFDISDLPVAVMPISEETAQEELRD